MSVPAEVLAACWIPLLTITVLILLFSFAYVRCYHSRTSRSLCSSLTAHLGLALVLLTSALVPIDVFLAAFMKDNGAFKHWAVDLEVRNSIENSILIAYFVLYGCVISFIFFVLPFAYFFYEEGDEETSLASRCCTTVKYSLVCVLVAGVLFVIGVFVPFRGTPSSNSTNNSEWDEIKNILIGLESDRGVTALSFVVSCLATVGVLSAAVYTASGMSCWPIDLICGTPNVTEDCSEEETSGRSYRSSYSSVNRQPLLRSSRTPYSSNRRRIRPNVSSSNRSRCWGRCASLLRPFEIIIGVLFLLFGLLVFVTLLLTNIDKILHSLGMNVGYVLTKPQIFNPLDATLVFLQQVYPLDYILMSVIILYMFLCSMSGIQRIGIWFCWIRMYKVQLHRTKPQALLFVCFMLMFIILALNLYLYQLMPQYMTYGSQHYIVNGTAVTNVTVTSYSLEQCNTQASKDECTSTRISGILYQLFYKFWFFGAFYFWVTWAFLLVFVIGVAVSVIRRIRQRDDGYVDEPEDSSDDEVIQ